MSRSRRSIALAAVALVALAGPAPASAEELLPARQIPSKATDPAINFPATGDVDHFIWLAADPDRRIGKLFVFLPGAGNNQPRDWQLLGAEAARLGYHTIVLAYRNDAPLGQRCPGEFADAASPTCALDLRREVIDGVDRSPFWTITPTNSINNRLTKLLQYLKNQHPLEEWSQFLDASGEPMWSQVTISGHSLGAGEAVLIGMLRPVHRVIAFAGWSDARHGWVALTPQTSSDRYFALIHQRDTGGQVPTDPGSFFLRTCYAYQALGLEVACPMTGYPLVENSTSPYAGRHVLVTDLTPRNPTAILDPFHPSPSRDQFTPLAPDGTPLLLDAWRYVLGTDHDGDGVEHDGDNCAADANPDQQETDGDGVGDACDPDDDNDQLADSADNCVLVPNPDQADTDGDVFGDACDPTPGNTPGKVTGGGWLGEAKNSFGFTAQYAAGAEAPKGTVVYHDKAAGLDLRSAELTSVIVYGTTRAVVLGTATVNGLPADFRLELEDHGEPGASDTFRISWPGYEAGGILNGGNIQIH